MDGGTHPGAAECTLLIVDDIEQNRTLLRRRLSRLGYTQMVEAENGRRALELMAGQSFDLVLLDIMMPEVDGYQVLEAMKADASLSHIPVIVISALDEMDSVVRCIELGAEDYLTKPFNAVLLRARVGACLEKKRLHDAELAYLAEIDAQRKRADDLLNVILPAEAVRELKEHDEVRPRRHEGVAVLFTDIVGFTPYCDKHAAEDVVRELQTLVEAFESLAEEHGLEKIKTIGDAFMATGGLLRKVDNPVLAAVRCGLAMTAVCERLPVEWQVRVGISYGVVMAGVVGRRQYLFDVWGDTVNTAARVQASAAPGRVVITRDARKQVDGLCELRSLGPVDLKGKGEVELFEVAEPPAP